MMRSATRLLLIIVAASTWLNTSSAYAQEVTKEEVAGVVNFARLDTTVACAGAIKPEAIPELKQRGYKVIINLQAPEERDVDVAAESAAAQAAGINYVHVPLLDDGHRPDNGRSLPGGGDRSRKPAAIHPLHPRGSRVGSLGDQARAR